MSRNRLFWAVLLVVMGLLLLAGNLNLLPFTAWELFWPVFLILLGIWFLWGAYRKPQPVPREERVISLQNAEKARVVVKHGAGKLQVDDSAGPGELVKGTFASGLDARVESAGGELNVVIKPANAFFPEMMFPWNWPGREGLRWNFGLSPEIPLDLTFETGAAEADLDLRGLQVKDLLLKTGASATKIRMPAGAGQTFARLEAGAASVKVSIPDNVSARIETEGGLASIEVDEHRFVRQGEAYQSPDYEQAEHRLDLRVETGLGSIVIA